jgi:hypothetical protein
MKVQAKGSASWIRYKSNIFMLQEICVHYAFMIVSLQIVSCFLQVPTLNAAVIGSFIAKSLWGYPE